MTLKLRGTIGSHGWALPLLLLLATSPGWAMERYALLIGVTHYTAGGAPNLHDLPGTQNDLKLIQEVLQARLGVKPDHVQVLRDDQATHQNIERAFQTLAQRVQPGDFVYVHYSGHGSYIPDPTGHKSDGAYQTWVGYAARSPRSAGLDRFDILDDELNQWLHPIDARAGELVYVADSCHSATNTRGSDAQVTRAAPADDQQKEHPRLGNSPPPYQFQHAALIYASRNDESAHELTGEDQQPYGAFTWNWGQALQNVKPGETWEQIFTRAAAGVNRSFGNSQHPQIEGPYQQHPILGGEVSSQPAVMVREAGAPGVTLNAGRLSGVTPGSRYLAQQGNPPAELEVSQAFATWSQAKVTRGTVQTGDFLHETRHVYETAPLKIFFLMPSVPADSRLTAAVQALIPAGQSAPAPGALQGYERVNTEREADLVIALLKPQIRDGKPVFSTTPKGRNTLPDELPEAPPEVWVVTPAERLLAEAFRIPLTDEAKGLQTLRENLTKYRQVRAVSELAQKSGGVGQVEIRVIPYERCEAADCQRLQEGDRLGYRPRPDTLPLSALQEARQPWQAGDYLSFELQNTGLTDRFVYLIDVGPDGQIAVAFPPHGMIADAARLKPGARVSLHEAGVGILLDKPGAEGVLAMVTDSPINPYLLAQDSYTHLRGSTKGAALNPLEILLSNNLEGTRAAASFNSGSWGSQWVGFEVQTVRP